MKKLEMLRNAGADRLKAGLMAIWSDLKGSSNTGMLPHKLLRAEGLRIEGDLIKFTIDRHPGLHYYLLHTSQSWTVNLITGAAIVDESWTPLTFDALRNVRGRISGQTIDLDYIVDHSFQYMNKWIKENDYDPSESVDAFALAYCYLLAECSNRWRGGSKVILKKLKQTEDETDGLKEDADRYAEAARQLWKKHRVGISRSPIAPLVSIPA